MIPHTGLTNLRTFDGVDSSASRHNPGQEFDEVSDLVKQFDEAGLDAETFRQEEVTDHYVDTQDAEDQDGTTVEGEGEDVVARKKGDGRLSVSPPQIRKQTTRKMAKSLEEGLSSDEAGSACERLYSETIRYEDWVEEFEKIGQDDTDALLVTLFLDMLQQKKSFSNTLKKHLFTRLNSRLRDENFLELNAINVARAGMASCAWMMQRFEQYHLTDAKMELTSSNDEVAGTVHVLPLVESSRWRLLFMQYVIEAKTTHVPIKDKWRNTIVLVSHAIEHQSYAALKGKFAQVVEYLKKWDLPTVLRRIGIKMKRFSKQSTDFKELLDYLTAYELMGKRYGVAFMKGRLSTALERTMRASPADLIGYLECICDSNSLNAKKIAATLLVNNFAKICRDTLISTIRNEKLCLILERLSGIKKYIHLESLLQLTSQEIEMFMLLFSSDAQEYLNIAAGKRVAVDKAIVNQVFRSLSPELKKIRIASAHFVGNEQLQLLVDVCPDLQEIEMIGSTIRDLSCLSRLEELRVLRLPRSGNLSLETLPLLPQVVLADFSFCPVDDVTPLQRLLSLQQLMLKGDSEINLDALLRLESDVQAIDVSGVRKILFTKQGGETAARNVVMRGASLDRRQRDELSKHYHNCKFVFGKKLKKELK